MRTTAHQQPAHGTHALGVAGPAASVLRDVLVAAERAQSMATATASAGTSIAPGDVGAGMGLPYSVRNKHSQRPCRINSGTAARKLGRTPKNQQRGPE